MCKSNQPKEGRNLRKQDFIIPEDWEPTQPHVIRLRELKQKIINTLGSDFIRELLEEEGIAPKGELAREDCDRC